MTAATFQLANNVKQFMGFGIPGEPWGSGPFRAEPLQLASVSAANNVFGRAFSVTAGGPTTAINVGTAAAGNTTDAYKYAGIMVSPKDYALYGDGVNALNPSLILPNGVIGQFANFGEIVVQMTAIASVGDLVVFNNTDGQLSSIDPTDPLPAAKSPAYAIVKRYIVTSPGYLAVIELIPSLTYLPRV